MDKDTYQQLIEEYDPENPNEHRSLAEFLADHENAIRDIQTSIRFIDRRRNEEVVRHREAMKSFDKELIDVQNRCRHLSTTYHPDPSGNNDSHVECNHCGKEARRASGLTRKSNS